MVMYKQNQGLMAKGTVGTQSTGGTMMPKRNLMSSGGAEDFSGQDWGGKIPGRPTDFFGQVGYTIADMFTHGQYGRDRAIEAARARAKQEAAAKSQQDELTSMSQALGAAGMPAGGADTAEEIRAKYNQMLAARQTAQSQRVQAPQVGAMSAAQPAQQQVVTPAFRLPVQSRAESVVNPHSEEHQRMLEGQAVEQAEQQAAIQARQLSSQLATSGLMSGGPAGLSAALGQQLAMQTGGERSRALRDIGLQVPGKRAEFEMARAREIDAYNRNLQSVALDLEMQPSRVGTAQAQLQAQNIQNAINGLDLNTRQRLQETVISDAKIQNEINKLNLDAAQVLQFMNDPTQWWNHPAWPLLSRVAGLALQIPSGAYGAAGGAISNVVDGMMSAPTTRGMITSPSGDYSIDTKRGRYGAAPLTQPSEYTTPVRPYNQRQGIR
jgi:hypothetical protein